MTSSSCDVSQLEKSVSINKLKEAYFSLKTSKSAGYDDFNFNIVKNCFEILEFCFECFVKCFFNLSIQRGIFPDKQKIERVTLIIKEGIECDIDNYRPISLLSCFSRMFEKIIYICLYIHLYESNLLYNTVCFPEGSFYTKHVIMQLVDQINSSFEKNLFALEVPIDLSKTFNTVDDGILISKLEKYGV